jgi:hypothetical protein
MTFNGLDADANFIGRAAMKIRLAGVGSAGRSVTPARPTRPARPAARDRLFCVGLRPRVKCKHVGKHRFPLHADSVGTASSRTVGACPVTGSGVQAFRAHRSPGCCRLPTAAARG